MRFEGTIRTWNDERGFGFIEPAQGGQEIFIHIKAFTSRAGRPQQGQRVTFEVELNTEGKKRARAVEPFRSSRTSARSKTGSPAQRGTAGYFAILAFAVLYVGAAIVWQVPVWVAGLYLAASVVALFTYAFDKSAAGESLARTGGHTACH